jgi:hypothetical protein
MKDRYANLDITVFGDTKSLRQWAEDRRCAVKYSCLSKRIKRGWGSEKAICTPSKPNSNNLTKEERKINKKEYIKLWHASRKKLRICKECNKPCCDRSIILCEHHLESHNSFQRQRHNLGFARYCKLKCSAKARGIQFLFNSKAEFEGWYNNQFKICTYCTIDEKMLSNCKDPKHRRLAIDRKNNSFGYSVDNCCLACFRCNATKSSFFSYEAWKQIANDYIITNLVEYHKSSFIST